MMGREPILNRGMSGDPPPSGGRAPLGRSRHTQTSCASKASLRRRGVRITCGPIFLSNGLDCVKSLRSSYTGLFPQMQPRIG